ncbi:MAG: hypothetical protein WA958_12295 [Tunicatimonas sp.]
MAEQAIISLDEEAYAFLEETAGQDKSAYINALLKKEKQRRLEEATLKANREEAEDEAYQQELTEWDATLSDGLEP